MKVYVLLTGPYETSARDVVGVYASALAANAKMSNLISIEIAEDMKLTRFEHRLKSTAWEDDGEWGVNLTQKGWGGGHYGYTFHVLERELVW